jgi:excisionase family DNA binding protein
MRSDEAQVYELLSVGRVSQRLACSRGLVYRLIATGVLPAVRLGGDGASLRVNERELEDWLRSRDTRRITSTEE